MEQVEINDDENSNEEPEKEPRTVREEESEEDEDEENECEADLEAKYWRDVMTEVAETHTMANPSLYLKEPFLSQIVDEMKEIVEEKIQFTKHMEETNEVYCKLNKTIEKYEEMDMDRQEAVDAAWHARRFLFKDVIEDNLDLLKEKAEENEADEGEAEEPYPINT